MVCPFAVLRSRFGLRYSRVRGRRQSKFLASSSTGGAQNFYPSIRSEAPSFIVARAAKPLVFGAKHQTQNVVRQSRTNILPKIHRGAEKRSPSPSVRTGEPRNTLSCLCATSSSKCARTAGTHSFFMCPKGALHVPKARFIRHSVLHLRSKKIPSFDKSKDGNKSRGTTFVGNAQSSSCPVTAASRPILLAPGRFPSAAWE